MIRPNWFDEFLAGGGVDLGDAAKVAAVIAKNPRFIAAIRRGIDRSSEQRREHKYGASETQFIRQSNAEELQAED